MFSKILNKTRSTSKIDNYNEFLEFLLQRNFNEKSAEKKLESLVLEIDDKDSKGNTFLNHCIENEKFQAASWLIEKGIDVSIENNLGDNSFHFAIEKKEPVILKKILEKEVININEKDKFGRIILQDLVVEGELGLAKLLINYGADVNSQDKNHRNVIFDALSFGEESFVLYLLELDEPKISLNNVDHELNSVMHHNEVIKNENIAQKLIESGADTTIQNAKGETYLTNLAKSDNTELAKKLIELSLKHGADANAKTTFDSTIFMELMKVFTTLSKEEVLRRQNILDIAKSVLSYGGDVNAVNKDKETALFDAIRVKDFELVSFLLSNGTNPNIINIHGNTVLLELILQGVESLDLLLLMLEYDADPLIRNLEGKTIYEVLNDIVLHAHEKKFIEDEEFVEKLNPSGQYMVLLKELLKHNKKDLNFLDSTGNPLFFNPLLYDDSDLFRLYINNGLNIHTVNKLGYNIFFAYVLKVFQDNDTSIKFQDNLSRLISKKVDQNFQDDIGATIIHKILSTKCNDSLFTILTKVVKFNLKIKDDLGRSVIHSAVWNNNKRMIKKLHLMDGDLISMYDNYGILPVGYAALLGSQELVLLFIKLKSEVKGGHKVPENAKKKFSPMLKNLAKIKTDIQDPEILEKMEALIEQIQIDFEVPVSLRIR